jgi:hypothetical protein
MIKCPRCLTDFQILPFTSLSVHSYATIGQAANAAAWLPTIGTITFCQPRFAVDWEKMEWWRIALAAIGCTYFARWKVTFQIEIRRELREVPPAGRATGAAPCETDGCN